MFHCRDARQLISSLDVRTYDRSSDCRLCVTEILTCTVSMGARGGILAPQSSEPLSMRAQLLALGTQAFLERLEIPVRAAVVLDVAAPREEVDWCSGVGGFELCAVQ